MGPHLSLQETLLAEHRREMMHEIEQQRLASKLPHARHRVRHSIALVGKICIMLGQWLERVEPRQRTQGVVFAGTGPLHVGEREPHALN